MLDRTIAEKYYEYTKELDKYYNDRKEDIKLIDVVGSGDKQSMRVQLLEYFRPWIALEEGQEVDQLYFKFNHSLNELSKYIGVIDRLGDILYVISSNELKKSSEGRINTKNFSNLLVGAGLEDYKNNNILSRSTKDLAEIYFKFKDLETDLVKWFKTLQKKVNYETRLKQSGMYI